MANYATLKAAINAVIRANGNKEITGTVLNETLTAMVNSLGANYQFAGVATPSTNPGTPDQNVFYIAGQAGTYTNFNSIVLPNGVSVLKWNGSWSSETVLAGDGVFDISAYKATGGTLATFADLSAALDSGNNIPSALRKGGMMVKFIQGTVQSSDNKYVQARCMAQSFTTNTTQWQGVDDEPTAGSNNLVKSRGVVKYIAENVRDLKNITILDGVQNKELKVYENILYLLAYNLDLTGYRLTTVYDGSGYSKRVIFNTSDNQIMFDMSSNTARKTVGDGVLFFGYDWSKHTENINSPFAESKLAVSESIKSSESVSYAITKETERATAAENEIKGVIHDIAGDKHYVKSEPVQTSAVYDEYYLTPDGYIGQLPGYSNFKVREYPVNAGQTYIISGKAALGGAFPIAAFRTTNGTSGAVTDILEGSSTSTVYNEVYTPTENGYLFIAESGNGILAINNGEVNFDINLELKEIAGDKNYVKTDVQVQTSAIYEESYLTPDGWIGTLAGNYAFKVREYPVTAGNIYIISGRAALAGDFPILAFRETSGKLGRVTDLLQGSATKTDYYYVYIPETNGYIFVAEYGAQALYVNVGKIVYDINIEIEELRAENPWRGKKVVWIGTSVPFGQNATKSYAQEVANYLKFNLVNCSVPGLAIQMSNGHILQYGSLSASKAECAADGMTIPEAPITPYVPGGSYNDYYRTWENVFTQDNADADMFVFDVVPNNVDYGLTDWNAFDKSNWKYSDDSTFAEHRNTFIGALLFLMDKMYTLNPNARMVLLLGSAFAYTEGKSAFDTISERWNIDVINLWGNVNTSPKSLQVLKSLGGTDNHPSTYAHERMGRMLIGEFMKLA